MVPIIIPIQSYPQYIKRDDLEWFIERTAKSARAIGIILPLMGIILQSVISLIVLPKMGEVYTSVGRAQPNYSFIIIFLSLFLGIGAILYNLTLSPLNQNLINELRNDKSDMVSIKKTLINKKLWFVSFGYIFFTAFTLIASIVLPIYLLSSSI